MDKRGPVLWASEAVLVRDDHGRHWSLDPVFESGFAADLAKLGQVVVVARVRSGTLPDGGIAIEPLGCSVAALPAFKGPGGFVCSLPRLIWQMFILSGEARTALLRLPGAIGGLLGVIMVLRGKHFAVQMSGDPDTVLRAHGFSWIERRLRLPFVMWTRWLCRRASAVAYVTGASLQRAYPPSSGASGFVFSNVRLAPADYALKPAKWDGNTVPVALFCGSLEQSYKGLDVLLRALAGLVAQPISLRVIGDGAQRRALEMLAADLGLASIVTFEGQLERPAVLEAMRSADLFIMPSRTEGMPRALVEAMAQGLPCIGSDIGGIPELLDLPWLVPVDDPAALARCIAECLSDPGMMHEMARINLARAQDFAEASIRDERRKFVAVMSDF